jgi:hypothetical protein
MPSTTGRSTMMPLPPPVSSPPARMPALTMCAKASVVMARYRPCRRSEGMPTMRPNSAGSTADNSSAISGGRPQRVTAMA